MTTTTIVTLSDGWTEITILDAEGNPIERIYGQAERPRIEHGDVERFAGTSTSTTSRSGSCLPTEHRHHGDDEGPRDARLTRSGRDGERPPHRGRHVAVEAVEARRQRDRPRLRLTRVEYRARLDRLPGRSCTDICTCS